MLLCSCQAEQSSPGPSNSQISPAAAVSTPQPPPKPEPVSVPEPVKQPADIKSQPDWTAEQAIEAYFDAHYQNYLTMSNIDISDLLDLEQNSNKNLLIWLKTLNQRRRLLKEHDLCYVETERFSYEIVYDDKPEDDRMNFWQRRMNDQYDAVFHLRLRGEEGKAYPPTFALNSQHSIFLKKVDGVWKIVRHYYPGAVRNFYFANSLELLPDEQALAELKKEFAPAEPVSDLSAPNGARIYDPTKATEYARAYAEAPNEIYYHVGDWHGNCQNFVSQCISCGFGDEQNPDPMTKDWFAGSGGGTSPWENVDYFWNFAVTNKKMGGQTLPTVTCMREGDVLQLRSLGRNDPDDFSHTLIMVDAEKGVLAQNSPPNFAYYSDLVNIEARFFRPEYLANIL